MRSRKSILLLTKFTKKIKPFFQSIINVTVIPNSDLETKTFFAYFFWNNFYYSRELGLQRVLKPAQFRAISENRVAKIIINERYGIWRDQ